MVVHCIILFNKDMHHMKYQIFGVVTVLFSNMQIIYRAAIHLIS